MNAGKRERGHGLLRPEGRAVRCMSFPEPGAKRAAQSHIIRYHSPGALDSGLGERHVQKPVPLSRLHAD